MAAKKRPVPKAQSAVRTEPAPSSSTKKSRSATNMRSDMRDLTLSLIQERQLKLADLSRLGEEVLDQVTVSVQRALPASRQNALRQLVDGFADAWAATAEASAEAVRHARENGVRMASRDLSQLGKSLRSLERDFIATLEKYSKRLEGEAKREFNALIALARKTGTTIRPAVQSAGRAVLEHPLETVGGLASTGMKVGADALGGMLLGASGVLEGLGKSIRGERGAPKPAATKTPAAKTAADKTPATKTPATKTPVKKTAAKKPAAKKKSSGASPRATPKKAR